MPAAVPSGVRPTVEPDDDLDDIFNYDAGINATFNQQQDDANNNDTVQDQHDVPVNIDEEVKVTKKRKPVAKLDEERYVPIVQPNTFTPNSDPFTAFFLNKAFQSSARSPKTAFRSRVKVTNFQTWHASSTHINYGLTTSFPKQSSWMVYL